eukprot:CAMPEP_0113484166 /NCGR_PEP_ID=MMETSP0014_2-20120614/23820_1 /TAXON_ID=2857 /ORGANISM="Nitzschia sp." /LENGTH=42 /DNA_ID=CAMNT_0000377757 /DNA_START=174 /DNA_END=298 /DNA_ORIENTATION=+ /assembly_acc=CAM_ASM_000159
MMFKSLLSLTLVASAAAFAPASPAFVSRSAAVSTNTALFMSA